MKHKVEICLNFENNQPIPNADLQLENFRSESRWARSVLESLLNADWVDKVYSLYPVWKGSGSLHPKFVDGLPPGKDKDVIGIFYEAPTIAKDFNFKAVMMNVTATQAYGNCVHIWDSVFNCKNLLDQFKKKYNKNFFITAGYLDCQKALNLLINTTGQEYFEFLPIPNIPKITHQTNNFNKKKIVYASRSFLNNFIRPEVLSSEAIEVFKWVSSKLKEDPLMEFHIFSGESIESMNFHKCTNIDKEFNESISMKIFVSVRNQVKIHFGMDWKTNCQFWSEVKIPVSSESGFFNTQIEAAAYGIPTILHHTTPESNFLNASWGTKEYIELLEKLYTDENFYRTNGEFYKKCVEENHTFDVFSNNLFKILKQRGII